MKRRFSCLAGLLMMGLVFSGMASGADLPCGPPMQIMDASLQMQHPPGPQHPPLPPGLMLLMRCQEINVISGLTGLTQENVRQLLISSPAPSILEAYGITPDAFFDAMDKQTTKLVKQASVSGIISKKQEEEILKKMAQRPIRKSE